METYTAELAAVIPPYVEYVYSELMRDFAIAAVGAVLLAVGGCAIAGVLGRRAALDPDRAEPRRLHAVIMLAIVIVLLILAFGMRSVRDFVAFVPALVVGVGTLSGLLRWRAYGVPLAVAFWWVALLPPQVTAVQAALTDRAGIASYAPVAQIGVFAASNVLVSLAAAAIIALALVSIVTVSCYARCSRSLQGMPRWARAWDDALSARKGAREMPSGQGGQDGAASPDGPGDQGIGGKIVRSVLDEVPDFAKSIAKAVGIALVIVVLVVPNMVDNLAPALTQGSAQVSNDFVTMLTEVGDDPALAQDEEWLASFDQACERLMVVDDRPFRLDPHEVYKTEVPFFVSYAQASFDQMQVVEQIHDAVHAPQLDLLPALSASFDQTLAEQNDAVLRWGASATASVAIQSASWLEVVGNVVGNSALAVLRVLSLFWVGIAAGVIGIACLAGSVLLVRRGRALASASPVAPAPSSAEPAAATAGSVVPSGEAQASGDTRAATDSQVAADPQAAADSQAQALGGGRFGSPDTPSGDDDLGAIIGQAVSDKVIARFGPIGAAVLVVALAVFIVFFAVIPKLQEPIEYARSIDYLGKATNVVIGRSSDVATMLVGLRASGDGDAEGERVAALLAAIDEQLASIDALEATPQDQVPDDFSDFNERLLGLCAEEGPLLREIRASLESGEQPSPELVSDYMALRGESYQGLVNDFMVMGVNQAVSVVG